MRVLANDGISAQALETLRDQGFEITADHIPQEKLAAYINEHKVVALLVRSATTVRKELIEACPKLKLIDRGGVGMDKLDKAYAKARGLRVINTPASSSISVAELVMAHLFSLMRDLYQSNRRMPAEGSSAEAFKAMKKTYGKGSEMRGKTLGIVGFGRIGQWVARYAVGNGMKVIYTDNHATADNLEVQVNGDSVRVGIRMMELDELLAKSDAITLHVPATKDGSPVLGDREFGLMRKGVVIVNTARGNSLDEDALLKALNSGHVRAAGLDVYANEPTPRADLLAHPHVSLSPHIGAATGEAQDRIGDELADLLIAWRDEVTVGRG